MGLFDVVGSAIGSIIGRQGAEEDRRHQEVREDDIYYRNLAQSERQAERNIALQKEFAQHGIQWRVADAQAAGLHPLYAIGGSGASFSPNPVVIPGGASPGPRHSEDLGQNLSRAVMAQSTELDLEARRAQLELLKAQTGKEVAIAQYYASQAGRDAQSPSIAFPEVGQPRGVMEDPIGGSFHNRSVVKPAEIISPDFLNPYKTSGAPSPGFTEFRIGKDGLRILLPQSNEGPAESLESVSWWMWPGIIKLNADHYGKTWIKDLASQYVPGYSSLSDGVELARNALSVGMEEMWQGTAWERAHALSKMGRGPSVKGRIRQR